MATVTSTIRIGPADNGRLMTLEEFREAEVEEGYRYELARGALEVSEVPNDPHGSIVWIILRFIAVYDLSHPRVIGRAGGGSRVSPVASRHDFGAQPRRRRGPSWHAQGLAWPSSSVTGLRSRLRGTRSSRSRLHDQASRVPGLWLARVLDRRSSGENRDRADPRRRRLGRAGLSR